jgi:hypothetical protein
LFGLQHFAFLVVLVLCWPGEVKQCQDGENVKFYKGKL